MTGGYVSADHLDPVSSAAFPTASNISGVDLGDSPEAVWYVDLAPAPGNPNTAPWGAIMVYGFDPNATPTRSVDPLARLDWSK